MRHWHMLIARLRSLLFRSRAERELDEELRLHLELEVERLIATGLSRDDARAAARRRFGGVEQVKEECRDSRGLAIVEGVTRDAGYALRRLLRDRAFTAAAILILALGIGANTAMFSVVNTVLFRPQPFSDPERLVEIYQDSDEGEPRSSSYPAYRDMRAHTDVFAGVSAAYVLNAISLHTDNGVQPAIAEFVTASHFPLLGLRPLLGRGFDENEDSPGADPVAIVSHRTWRTRLDADPGIIGRTVRLNGALVTIVGVGPEGYNSTLSPGLVTDFWLSISALAPVAGTYSGGVLERRHDHWFFVKGRLRDGVTIAQAQAAMDGLATRLTAEYPTADGGRRITVLPARDVRIHPAVDAYLLPAGSLLLVIVGLVLLIACSNVATLLLVRGSSRARELAVRLALGATRRQLVRQLLVESVLLSAAGGVAGWIAARWLIAAATAFDPAIPVGVDASPDARVMGFAVALSLLTGLVFGLAPALNCTRSDLASAFRGGSEMMSQGRRWLPTRHLLVVVQVAASFLLLTGAGLLARSLVHARVFDVGFATEDVAFLQTSAEYAGYPAAQAGAIHEEIVRRMTLIPGVQSAALASRPPVGGRGSTTSLVIEGYQSPTNSGAVAVYWVAVGVGYFETLRIPILHGRGFEVRDLSGPPVAIVSEAMARRFFGASNAVGRRFRPQAGDDWTEIIGVAGDTAVVDVMEGPEPLLYRPLATGAMPAVTILARTNLDAGGLVMAMQRELAALDPTLPVLQARSMTRHLDDSLFASKAAAQVVGGVSGLGLVLAVVGLYAVVAYGAARRTREIGIRMAFGAQRRQVAWLVTRDSLALVGTGVAIGLGLSVLTAPALASVLFRVSPVDPATLAIVTVILVAAGAVAAYGPARRAAALDPSSTLRAE